MKLYYIPMTCSLAPQIAMKECGISSTLVKVDMKTHKLEDGSDYDAINPAKSVPLLVLDDGRELTEVIAVMLYISNLKPEAGLTPKVGTLEYYQVISRMSFLSTEIHKSVAPLFAGESAGAYVEVARQKIFDKFAYVDSILAKQKWFGSSEYSLADIVLFTMVNWFKADWNKYAVNIPVDINSFKNIEEWHSRVAQKETVKAAIAEGGPMRI